MLAGFLLELIHERMTVSNGKVHLSHVLSDAALGVHYQDEAVRRAVAEVWSWLKAATTGGHQGLD